MRYLALPSLLAISLGALAAGACGGTEDKPAATAGSGKPTTTTTGTGGSGGSTGEGGAGGTTGGGGSSTGTGGHGGSGGGAGGHAGGNGGAGGTPDAGPECTVAQLCPGQDEACKFRACIDGKCSMQFTPAGAPSLEAADPGTCQKKVCDGQGGVSLAPDDTNIPIDNNPCTLDACANGVPSNDPAPEGTICQSLGTPKYCDAKGKCIECKSDAECNGGTCTGGDCVGASPCNDSKKNGLETGVDCGGGVCGKCDLGQGCKAPADCMTGICTNNVCVSPDPTCNDLKKNQDETDVDCGGSKCPACDALKSCSVAADCKSTLCLGSLTKHCVADVTLNGCDIKQAENHIGEAKVSVSFGGGVGNNYSPACIIVTPGTKLTFNGDFSMHPLQGGTVTNGVGTPDPQSILQLTNQGFTATYTPSLPTNYGYYCTAHVASGMAGAIFVVP